MSVLFTDGYVTCPVCAPSRAGLLTGRYQQRFGFADNPGPFQRKDARYAGIPPSQPILSERLQTLGYTAGIFGKTHDGVAEEQMAFRRWDEFFGSIMVLQITLANSIAAITPFFITEAS